jgi:hypothetical protein
MIGDEKDCLEGAIIFFLKNDFVKLINEVNDMTKLWEF